MNPSPLPPPPPPSPEARRAARLYDEGKLGPAHRLCQQIVARQPNEFVAVLVLGAIAADQGRLDDAVEWFDRGIEIDPARPLTRVRLGDVRQLQGRYDDALVCFRAAVAIDPACTPAMAGQAEVLERQGRFAEADELLRPILARGDADARVIGIAALLRERTGRREESVELLERFLAGDAGHAGSAAARGRLLYQLGRVLDRLGETDRAFEAIRRANETWRRPYDLAQDTIRFDRWRRGYPQERCASMARAANASEQLVFIVGMPRCGSTLVEQILDAHPAVHGAGENEIVHRLVYGLPKERRDPRPPPEIFPELDAAALGTLSQRLLDGFRARTGDADRIVDKSLGNHLCLGALAQLVPNARVIHCVRDPMSICYSCYINPLPLGAHGYATDLGHLGRYYRAYERHMRHWRRVLDLRFLEVEYEALVGDQEGVSRAVVDFCGLPWDEACLRFHETGRAVATTSYDQVRRPMYRSAVKRYEPYEAHLGELREGLADG